MNYTMQNNGQRRESRMTMAELEQQAQQRSMQTGRSYEQEFDSLLQANPGVYQRYLDRNPAQTGR